MPEIRDDEALVRVARAAICHTDVIIKRGCATHVRYPFIPGHEFSGIVEACGAHVHTVQPGDRVAVHTIMGCGQCPPCRMGDTMACHHYSELGSRRDGGFAEYCAVPGRFLLKLPEHLSLEEGAMAEPLANAVAAVERAHIQPGERVVIIGPGAIGLLATAVACIANPSVVALVGTRDHRLALGKQHFGATHTVNIHQEGALTALKDDILGGKGADAIVECAGTISAVELALDLVGWHGRIVIEGSVDADERLSLSPKLLQKHQATLTGIGGWRTSDFQVAFDLLARGLVDAAPLITHRFALEQWEDAFDLATQRHSDALRVAFTPSEVTGSN
jgi:L-iditol 2-dehydrogenase